MLAYRGLGEGKVGIQGVKMAIPDSGFLGIPVIRVQPETNGTTGHCAEF